MQSVYNKQCGGWRWVLENVLTKNHASRKAKETSAYFSKQRATYTAPLYMWHGEGGSKGRGVSNEAVEALPDFENKGHAASGDSTSCRKRAKDGGLILTLQDEDKAEVGSQPRQAQ